jgi:SpoVK/Ycf46/Vps4 family AAA+-type ATPase
MVAGESDGNDYPKTDSAPLRDICPIAHLAAIKRLHEVNAALYKGCFTTEKECRQASLDELRNVFFSIGILFLRKQKNYISPDFTRFFYGIQDWIESDFQKDITQYSVAQHNIVDTYRRDATLTNTALFQRLTGLCGFLQSEGQDIIVLLREHLELLAGTDERYNFLIGIRITDQISEVVKEEGPEEEDWEEEVSNEINRQKEAQKKQELIKSLETSLSKSQENQEAISFDLGKTPLMSAREEGKTGDSESEEQSNSSQKRSDLDPVLEDELKGLIGLDEIKKDIVTVGNIARIQELRKNEGLPNAPYSYHMVFTGNPGTGKTTVARILGKMFKSVGCLSKGHFIECDRSMLVGMYMGETALKTKKILEKALGGILFIDEAYSLAQTYTDGDDSSGREAIDTILKYMEDNRDDLIVIAAGYKDEMETFITSNPGLKSRFNKYFHFEDYGADDLEAIFLEVLRQSHYAIDKTGLKRASALINKMILHKGENFGNGRTIRNFFEKCLANQANRVSQFSNPTKEDLTLLVEADIREADLFEVLK